MSPFDDNWLGEALDCLAVEIALNDPRTKSVCLTTADPVIAVIAMHEAMLRDASRRHVYGRGLDQ